MKNTAVLLFLSAITLSWAGANSLETYVQYGLENNLALQQNQFSYQQAEYALKAAKGLYLPKLAVNTRYTLAEGGRVIDFPIGDLMNPVYGTLNQMLAQQGREGGFPTLENEEIQFLRPQEYDASLSLTQPLYARSLGLNKKIAGEQLQMSALELARFKRELSFSIKEAYYNYLMTVQFLELMQRTRELVAENLRVTRKLYENNMVARDAVLRAKSDDSRVRHLETTLLKNQAMAQNYFNFLINRPLQDSITVDGIEPVLLTSKENSYLTSALEVREELALVRSKAQVYEYIAGLNRAENIPQVALAVQGGLQGEDFDSFDDSEYIMGSLVLNWTLFNGNVNNNKRQQALIEKSKAETQLLEVSERIVLEVRNDYLSLQEQLKNLEFATDRNAEASEVYRIVEKRYREGEAALIELLDARNNMLEAESELINTEYNLLISRARLEKSSGLSDL